MATVEAFDRCLEVQDRINYFLSDKKYSETSVDHFHIHLLSPSPPPPIIVNLLIYSGP